MLRRFYLGMGAGVLGAGILMACSGGVETGGGGQGGSGGMTSSSSSSSTTSGSAGIGGMGGQGGSAIPNPSCTNAAQGITSQISKIFCTAIVRLDYTTRDPLGFQIICGGIPSGGVTEASARATAQADTGFGQMGQFISGPAPQDHYVFVQNPSDFGGVAAVSAKSGMSVFGGGIVWDGKGDITYPKTWQPTSDLGLGCGPQASAPPPARGFDLPNGALLPGADVDMAVAVAWDTALADGFGNAGHMVHDALVLKYPRTVGGFDPAAAEWIVLFNSGLLD